MLKGSGQARCSVAPFNPILPLCAQCMWRAVYKTFVNSVSISNTASVFSPPHAESSLPHILYASMWVCVWPEGKTQRCTEPFVDRSRARQCLDDSSSACHMHFMFPSENKRMLCHHRSRCGGTAGKNKRTHPPRPTEGNAIASQTFLGGFLAGIPYRAAGERANSVKRVQAGGRAGNERTNENAENCCSWVRA